jgi:hypothetical protein
MQTGASSVDPAAESSVIVQSTDAPNEFDGWSVERPLRTDGKPWSRYLVRDASGRDGVLTLYDRGSEPDQAVHEVLRTN